KQQRLIAAAGQYLQQSPYADANIRFDVVEVLPAGSGWQVHCIRDAFASE
ncbi:choloylglycine hydrolase, partial [human gut metagenome]